MSDAGLKAALTEALRPVIDDEALTRTGRSLGDLASGHIAVAGVDALWPLVEAALSVARVELGDGCSGDS